MTKKKGKHREAVTASLKRKAEPYTTAKIKVVGVGGAGGNAVTRMFGQLPRSVDLIVVNTDVQDLNYALAKKKIHIGKDATRGLGTGMNPELGRQAAEESRAQIVDALRGADMVFVTAGFGGGTGTGAAPVVAEVAREMGILTIAVVTKPFAFEGTKRSQIAQDGILKLKDRVDTLITIPNDRIFSLIDNNTPLVKAFEEIDEVLKNSVQGVTELIVAPGIVNVDFADVKAIMQESGSAIIGIGKSTGAERSTIAANMAVASPLLELSIEGAKGVLFSVSGGRDLKMNEVNEIARLISESVDPAARIIFGTYHDRRLKKGQIKVILIATGFSGGGFSKGNYLGQSLFDRGPLELPSKMEDGSFAFGGESESSEARPLFPGEEPPITKGREGLEEKKGEDVWDIPAFLRKKRRKS